MAPISPNEAADTLRNIEAAANRSSTALGYEMASPHLILWGVIWVIGYGVSYVRPEWSIIWLPLVAVGSLASFWVGYRMNARIGVQKYDPRQFYTFLAVFIFIVAQCVIFAPMNSLQISTYFPILVAFYYALIGIWIRGTRMLLLGIATIVLTFAGYYWLHPHYLLWMAIVGGGGLILGGIWLRRV